MHIQVPNLIPAQSPGHLSAMHAMVPPAPHLVPIDEPVTSHTFESNNRYPSVPYLAVTQPPCHQQMVHPPPLGPMRVPPTEPAAFRRRSQPSFEPVGYIQQQQPVHTTGFQQFHRYGVPQQFHQSSVTQHGYNPGFNNSRPAPPSQLLNRPPEQYRPAGFRASNFSGEYAPQAQFRQQPRGSGHYPRYQNLSQRFETSVPVEQRPPVLPIDVSKSAPASVHNLGLAEAITREHPRFTSTLDSQAHVEKADVNVLSYLDPSLRSPEHNRNKEYTAQSDGGSFGPPQGDASEAEHHPPLAIVDPSAIQLENNGSPLGSIGSTTPAPASSVLSRGGVSLSVPPAEAAPISPQAKTMSVGEGLTFVQDFATHFAGDMNALATFEALCKDYNRQSINEVEFVTSMQRLLHRTKAVHLIAGFVKFLPAAWKDADMSWLNRAVAHDFDKRQKPLLQQLDIGAPSNTKSKQKKKRPINAFSTADNTEVSSGDISIVKFPVCQQHETSAPLTPPPSATEIPPAAFSNAAAAEGQPIVEEWALAGDVSATTALPVKFGKTDPATMSKRKASKQLKKSASMLSPPPRTSPTLHIPEGNFDEAINRKGQVGDKYAAEVKHVGPVYETRRAVLARTCRPYIHIHCGGRFSHPGDVKAHHKKANCLDLHERHKYAQIAWDEHPSCKADYAQINYAKVRDGYVILDRESHDKLHDAINAGMKTASELAKGYRSGLTAAGECAESTPADGPASAAEGAAKAKSKVVDKVASSSKATPFKSRKRVASTATASSPPANKKISPNDQAEDDGDAMSRAAALGLRERK